LLENRFIASAFFSNLHLPLCDSLCEVILKNRFCQTAIGDPIKHRGPYFAIFADSIAVFNTPVVWPTYASNLVHWMIEVAHCISVNLKKYLKIVNLSNMFIDFLIRAKNLWVACYRLETNCSWFNEK